MNRNQSKILATLALVFLVASMIQVKAVGSASVWTDKKEYHPEEIVTIFGSGFETNSLVYVGVTRPDSHYDEWTVTSDEAGSFTTTYRLDGITGTYHVVATDSTNTALTTFTDDIICPKYSITIDKINEYSSPWASIVFTNSIHLEGSVNVTDFYWRQLSEYQVQVDWGDGTVDFDSMTNFTATADGKDFSGPWSSIPDHIYALSGNYTIVVKFYYGQPPGQDSGLASYSATIGVGAGITVTTNPSGLVNSIVVDGITYTSPQTFFWITGSSHTIATNSPISGGLGIQYIWTGWSDVGDQSHTYIVPETAETVTADYATQYYLTVVSVHDTPTSSAWVNAGDDFNASVTSPDIVDANHNWICTGHSIDGGLAEAGTYHVFTAVSAAHSIVFNWQEQFFKDQFYISVISDHGNPTQGSQWVDAGSDFSVSVTTPDVAADDGHRWVLAGVSIDGIPQTVSSSVTLTNVQANHEIVFSWKTLYYLTVVSAHDTPSGDGWYDSGSNAYATLVVGTIFDGSGIQYVFTGWNGTACGTGLTSSAIFMDAPKNVVAGWKTLYYLTVVTSPVGLDSPTGADWYDAGATAYISTAQFVDIIPGVSRYRFDSWTGASGSYSDAIVLMDSAKTAIANYVAGNVPMISLWPTTGFSDTTVYGKGFASNSQIHLTLNGSDTSNGPVVVSSDEAGSFTAILNRVSLNQNAGNYTVQAIDGSGGSAIAYFLALEPAKGLDGPAGQNGQDLPPGYLAGYILLYIIVALVSAWAITRWRQRKGDEEGNQANKQQLL